VVTWSSVVPVRRIITASDAEGYGRRHHDDQRDLQNRLAAIQGRAAVNACLNLEGAIFQGRGDGSLTAWPPTTSELDLITNYLRELLCELDRVNRTLSKSSKVRMRLAVTTGLAEEAPLGIPGNAAIKAALLVDSQQLREALRKAHRHSLAVILDDGLFQDVVKTELRGLRPEMYERVVIKDKYGEDHTAWITVPGADMRKISASSSSFPKGDANPQRAIPPEPDDKATKRKVPLPIAVALIGAMSVITAAAITAMTDRNPSAPTTPDPTLNSTSAPTSTSASGQVRPPVVRPSPGSLGKLYPEKTYNHQGTDVFSDPMGDAVISGPVSIPFGTHVLVKCWAPNESEMSSINAFYLVETKPWANEYAPADTFLNTDTSEGLDPLVPECPTV